MILECFLSKYVHFNATKLKCALEEFYHFTIFGFKNVKINFLKKISVLISVLSNRSIGDHKPV